MIDDSAAALPPDPDSNDEAESPATGTTRRRRGTRGGRGRSAAARASTESDASENGNIDEHPSVAGRRSARGDDESPQATAKKAPARRASSTRTAATKAATKEATPADDEQPQASEAVAEEAADKEQQPAPRTRRRAASASTEPATATTSTTTTRTKAKPAAADTASADGVAPSAQIAALTAAMVEMQLAIEALGVQVERATRHERLGVFVDVPNLLYGAERVEDKVDMGRLLDYLAQGRELVRATAYAPVSDNPAEPVQQQRFVSPFVRYSYRIVTKPLKRFQDGSIKGNFDVEMALDMVAMADRLDVVCIISGDADFSKAVEMLQERGVRVEVVAFAGSTSVEIRALADHFIEVGSILDQVRPL